MARHSAPRTPTARRVLRALTTAGLALGAGAGAASAAPAAEAGARPVSLADVDPQAGLAAATGTVGNVTGPVANLKPNPLAGTGVDPLDNGVGTQLSDFRPVSSQDVTGPVAQAPSLGGVPVAGQALGAAG
ncbi:hypothetical protein ACFY93_01200 [Streptomyces sp. NPDC008313]|uniref:hypothetical protein n=1 Tax=Streptomyces sp. NPDC008313 TaxID=3364826 RepID=UPI0036EC9C93